MSLYKRLHTPNSPLMPLSPMPMASPSMFLSPYTTSIRSRRSFTPGHLNVLPPPSLSPIQANILSAKNKQQRKTVNGPITPPEQQLESTLIMSSNKLKSMKKVRSVARMSRKIETRDRLMVPLTPIRRVLFSETSPQNLEIETPKASSTYLATPNWRKHLTPKPLGTPAGVHISSSSPGYMRDHDYHVTPTLLDETFTVMSILKEINMEKYIALFAREEIDLFVFLMLTNDDMVELGINRTDRIVLLKAIHCYTEFFGNPETMYH